MQKFNRSVSAAILAVAVAGGGYAFLGSPMTPSVQAHLKDHPKLEKADKALKEAKEYVEGYGSDFHGHKAGALHAIMVARTKISLCVEEAEKKASFDNGRVIPLADRHIKLHDANFALKEARDYLNEAKSDFHGHKQEALTAIDEAMKQIDGLIAD